MTSCVDQLVLLPATMADADALYAWRNDPPTRLMSRATDAIDFDGHCRWLDEALRDADRRLLVAWLNGVCVGTVRFDKRDTRWEVSWTVSPQHRKMGIGAGMLAKAIDHFDASALYVAEIKPENIASEKIAERCGFRRSGGPRNGLQSWLRG